jgi:hypothetical protein
MWSLNGVIVHALHAHANRFSIDLNCIIITLDILVIRLIRWSSSQIHFVIVPFQIRDRGPKLSYGWDFWNALSLIENNLS